MIALRHTLDGLAQGGQVAFGQQVVVHRIHAFGADGDFHQLARVGRRRLGEEALNAARLMNLPATVIYLASLAVENRRNLRQAQVWLAIYQSLARSAIVTMPYMAGTLLGLICSAFWNSSRAFTWLPASR